MTEILITVEVIFKRMPIMWLGFPSLTAVHMPTTRTLGGTVVLALILSYVFFDFFFFILKLFCVV